MATFHIGLDDTDSLKRGCTTYICALLVEQLAKESKFLDYPNLIRLNPNIPWKSRGNAAVCLRLCSERSSEELLAIVSEVVEKHRDIDDEKNQPGIAVLEGGVPACLKDFSRRTLYDVLSLDEAIRIAEKNGVRYKRIRGGMGLIGALAAIGNPLEEDHTFEIAVYRREELWGKKRDVDYESVVCMDLKTWPNTFNNVDYEKRRMLITPHGPDPVLLGIRGESPDLLIKAMRMVKFNGGERWTLYRSNQGTDAHLSNIQLIRDLKPYQASVIKGKVERKPDVLKGGHVITTVGDDTGTIDIAAYEPSGRFKDVVRSLLPNDVVMAYGGVHLLNKISGKITFNLEKLKVVEQISKVTRNPFCTNCSKSMKSEGKGKGYQCKRCGLKAKQSDVQRVMKRFSQEIYLPPPRAVRHLTKPLQRYGREKSSWEGCVGEFYGFF